MILHNNELLHLHHVTEQTEKCLYFTQSYVKHFYTSSKSSAHIFLGAFLVCTHKHTYFLVSLQNYQLKSISLKGNLHFLCSKQK